MNRHELREKAMITVYQYLLVERDIDELIEDTFNAPEGEIEPYFVKVVKQSVDNTERYSQYIDKVLVDGWHYDRLGKIEQAILLNGCAEFDLKETEAAVIIDESVQLAKKYCDADTYKLINSVLDVI
jgi:N utilization substance protein B